MRWDVGFGTHSKKSLIPRKIKKRPLTGVEIPQKNVYYIKVLKFSKWPKIYYIYSNLLNKKSVSTKKFTISRFFTISIVTISRFDCSFNFHNFIMRSHIIWDLIIKCTRTTVVLSMCQLSIRARRKIEAY